MFSASPDFTPEPKEPAVQHLFSSEEIEKKEMLIRNLEERGLWRRALTELGILAGMQKTALGVGLIAHRRTHCLRMLAK